MPIITLSNGRSFPSDPEEVLLDAAKRASITIGYSCRTGRCSTCKSRVVSGASSPVHEELGLSPAEKSDGWILSCVRTATSDMALQVEDLGELTLPPVKTLPCRIHSIEKLAPDVVKVSLRLPPSSQFLFQPGQYIDVLGPRGLRRSYSVANAPRADNLLELHIREVDAGAMSQYWFNEAKEADLLRLNGPLGTFFLRATGGLDLIFLATGTGIAPVKAMLEGIASLPEQERPRSVAVYWGGRRTEDLYWDAANVDNVHRYVPVLSRAGVEWQGRRGHVQQALMADQPDLATAVVFACGSEAMIHSARDLLLAAGLPARRYFSDAFVCSADSSI
jgi:CDP-4-dehydro-6-deoxyglucose reductase